MSQESNPPSSPVAGEKRPREDAETPEKPEPAAWLLANCTPRSHDLKGIPSHLVVWPFIRALTDAHFLPLPNAVDDRTEVKSLGGRWDPDKKKWFGA